MIYVLIVGALAGWLSGKIMNGTGFGILIDILVGIAGGWIGNFIFNRLNLHFGGFIGELVTAVIGALILLYIVKMVRGNR